MNYIWSKRCTSIKFGGGEEKKDKGKKKIKKKQKKMKINGWDCSKVKTSNIT